MTKIQFIQKLHQKALKVCILLKEMKMTNGQHSSNLIRNCLKRNKNWKKSDNQNSKKKKIKNELDRQL